MHYWLIRAGEKGKYFSEFIEHGAVAIGWSDLGDLSRANTLSELKAKFKKTYRNSLDLSGVGQLWTFYKEIQEGDVVITPNPLTRTLYIGKIASGYRYGKKWIGNKGFPNARKVSWEKEVSRDVFSKDMKHSLGALQTLFNVDKYSDEIENVLEGKTTGMAAGGRIKFPKKPKEEVTIGEPLDFAGMTNAPIEENGVIFLFGKLHERMGFRIRAIRKGFPDAIGEVWIKGKLYPRRIEFEYKSSNFKQHGHNPDECDIIVCWEHDWADCPGNIFVLELKSEIANYIEQSDKTANVNK